LNVKSQTLKSRLHRGRAILRERLAEVFEGRDFEASAA
jgi:DNA-directed RNA polymerase specialized sigma24 family protein